MDWRVRLKRGGNAFILLVLLFLSNFIVGGGISNVIMLSDSDLINEIRILFIVLPGPISTLLIYLIYRKISFLKKIDLPSVKLNIYLFIQGLMMMVLEPMALLMSVVATDASSMRLKEILIGYSIVWIPVNGAIWLFFVLSLMFKEKEKTL